MVTRIFNLLVSVGIASRHDDFASAKQRPVLMTLREAFGVRAYSAALWNDAGGRSLDQLASEKGKRRNTLALQTLRALRLRLGYACCIADLRSAGLRVLR